MLVDEFMAEVVAGIEADSHARLVKMVNRICVPVKVSIEFDVSIEPDAFGSGRHVAVTLGESDMLEVPVERNEIRSDDVLIAEVAASLATRLATEIDGLREDASMERMREYR